MKPRASALLGLALLVLSPLAGIAVKGIPPAFFEFPPLTRYIQHAPFCPFTFTLFAVLFGLTALLLFHPRLFGFSPVPLEHGQPTTSRFPWWARAGLVLNLAAWTFSWGQFGWLGPFKEHMFFPLWLGYILTVDGLVYRRTARSILSRSPLAFLALFPASAAAWWYFEYLNRFVQNWWYEGVAHFTALHYAGFATLCFSTVLPALFETRDLLDSFAGFRNSYSNGPRIKQSGRLVLWSFVLVGILGLFLMALYPNPLFFLTWLSPLLLLEGILGLGGFRTFLADLAEGDYRRLITFAFAAVLCGFFWEMWNFWSLPKWHYSVPYVYRWCVFEMPIAGYTGYVPFGPVSWYLWTALSSAFGRSLESRVPSPKS